MERTAEIGAAAAVGRKRKVCIGESSEISTSSIQLKNRRLTTTTENSASISQSSGNLSCETATASCCSSNGSSEVTKETSKFLDLEVFIANSEGIFNSVLMKNVVLFNSDGSLADGGIGLISCPVLL